MVGRRHNSPQTLVGAYVRGSLEIAKSGAPQAKHDDITAAAIRVRPTEAKSNSANARSKSRRSGGFNVVILPSMIIIASQYELISSTVAGVLLGLLVLIPLVIYMVRRFPLALKPLVRHAIPSFKVFIALLLELILIFILVSKSIGNELRREGIYITAQIGPIRLVFDPTDLSLNAYSPNEQLPSYDLTEFARAIIARKSDDFTIDKFDENYLPVKRFELSSVQRKFLIDYINSPNKPTTKLQEFSAELNNEPSGHSLTLPVLGINFWSFDGSIIPPAELNNELSGQSLNTLTTPPEHTVTILQSEYSIVQLGVNGIQYIQTFGLGPCVGLCLWDESTKTAFLAHIDSLVDMNSLIPTIKKAFSNTNIDLSQLKAFVVGGDSQQDDEIIPEIERLVSELGISDVYRDTDKPYGQSLLIDINTGEGYSVGDKTLPIKDFVLRMKESLRASYSPTLTPLRYLPPEPDSDTEIDKEPYLTPELNSATEINKEPSSKNTDAVFAEMWFRFNVVVLPSMIIIASQYELISSTVAGILLGLLLLIPLVIFMVRRFPLFFKPLVQNAISFFKIFFATLFKPKFDELKPLSPAETAKLYWKFLMYFIPVDRRKLENLKFSNKDWIFPIEKDTPSTLEYFGRQFQKWTEEEGANTVFVMGMVVAGTILLRMVGVPGDGSDLFIAFGIMAMALITLFQAVTYFHGKISNLPMVSGRNLIFVVLLLLSYILFASHRGAMPTQTPQDRDVARQTEQGSAPDEGPPAGENQPDEGQENQPSDQTPESPESKVGRTEPMEKETAVKLGMEVPFGNPPPAIFNPDLGAHERHNASNRMRSIANGDFIFSRPTRPNQSVDLDPNADISDHASFDATVDIGNLGRSWQNLASPGPDLILLRAEMTSHSGEKVDVEFGTDEAGNLYVRAPSGKNINGTLTYTAAVNNHFFGGFPIPDGISNGMADGLPNSVQNALNTIGINQNDDFRTTLSKMVHFFKTKDGSGLLEQVDGETSLEAIINSPACVCEQRATAAMIIGKHLGWDIRRITSTFHAWVEIRVPGTNQVIRVDLGGGIGNLNPNVETDPQQRPPPFTPKQELDVRDDKSFVDGDSIKENTQKPKLKTDSSSETESSDAAPRDDSSQTETEPSKDDPTDDSSQPKPKEKSDAAPIEEQVDPEVEEELVEITLEQEPAGILKTLAAIFKHPITYISLILMAIVVVLFWRWRSKDKKDVDLPIDIRAQIQIVENGKVVFELIIPYTGDYKIKMPKSRIPAELLTQQTGLDPIKGKLNGPLLALLLGDTNDVLFYEKFINNLRTQTDRALGRNLKGIKKRIQKIPAHQDAEVQIEMRKTPKFGPLLRVLFVLLQRIMWTGNPSQYRDLIFYDLGKLEKYIPVGSTSEPQAEEPEQTWGSWAISKVFWVLSIFYFGFLFNQPQEIKKKVSVSTQDDSEQALIPELRAAFGEFGNSRWYKYVVGPLIEEFGMVGFVLAVPFLLIFRVVSFKDLPRLSKAVTIHNLGIGYRGVPTAVGLILFYSFLGVDVAVFGFPLGQLLAAGVVALLSALTGYVFALKHEEGKRAPPIWVAVLTSLLTTTAFLFGHPELIFLNLLIHAMGNIFFDDRKPSSQQLLLGYDPAVKFREKTRFYERAAKLPARAADPDLSGTLHDPNGGEASDITDESWRSMYELSRELRTKREQADVEYIYDKYLRDEDTRKRWFPHIRRTGLVPQESLAKNRIDPFLEMLQKLVDALNSEDDEQKSQAGKKLFASIQFQNVAPEELRKLPAEEILEAVETETLLENPEKTVALIAAALRRPISTQQRINIFNLAGQLGPQAHSVVPFILLHTQSSNSGIAQAAVLAVQKTEITSVSSSLSPKLLHSGPDVVNVAFIGYEFNPNIMEGGQNAGDANFISVLPKNVVIRARADGQKEFFATQAVVFHDGQYRTVKFSASAPLPIHFAFAWAPLFDHGAHQAGLPLSAHPYMASVVARKDLVQIILEKRGIPIPKGHTFTYDDATGFDPQYDDLVRSLRSESPINDEVPAGEKHSSQRLRQVLSQFISGVLKPALGSMGRSISFFGLPNLAQGLREGVTILEKGDLVVQERIVPPLIQKDGINYDWNVGVYIYRDQNGKIKASVDKLGRIAPYGTVVNVGLTAVGMTFDQLTDEVGLSVDEKARFEKQIEKLTVDAYTAVEEELKERGVGAEDEELIFYGRSDIIVRMNPNGTLEELIMELNGDGAGMSVLNDLLGNNNSVVRDVLTAIKSRALKYKESLKTAEPPFDSPPLNDIASPLVLQGQATIPVFALFSGWVAGKLAAWAAASNGQSKQRQNEAREKGFNTGVQWYANNADVMETILGIALVLITGLAVPAEFLAQYDAHLGILAGLIFGGLHLIRKNGIDEFGVKPSFLFVSVMAIIHIFFSVVSFQLILFSGEFLPLLFPSTMPVMLGLAIAIGLLWVPVMLVHRLLHLKRWQKENSTGDTGLEKIVSLIQKDLPPNSSFKYERQLNALPAPLGFITQLADFLWLVFFPMGAALLFMSMNIIPALVLAGLAVMYLSLITPKLSHSSYDPENLAPFNLRSVIGSEHFSFSIGLAAVIKGTQFLLAYLTNDIRSGTPAAQILFAIPLLVWVFLFIIGIAFITIQWQNMPRDPSHNLKSLMGQPGVKTWILWQAALTIPLSILSWLYWPGISLGPTMVLPDIFILLPVLGPVLLFTYWFSSFLLIKVSSLINDPEITADSVQLFGRRQVRADPQRDFIYLRGNPLESRSPLDQVFGLEKESAFSEEDGSNALISIHPELGRILSAENKSFINRVLLRPLTMILLYAHGVPAIVTRYGVKDLDTGNRIGRHMGEPAALGLVLGGLMIWILGGFNSINLAILFVLVSAFVVVFLNTLVSKNRLPEPLAETLHAFRTSETNDEHLKALLGILRWVRLGFGSHLTAGDIEILMERTEIKAGGNPRIYIGAAVILGEIAQQFPQSELITNEIRGRILAQLILGTSGFIPSLFASERLTIHYLNPFWEWLEDPELAEQVIGRKPIDMNLALLIRHLQVFNERLGHENRYRYIRPVYILQKLQQEGHIQDEDIDQLVIDYGLDDDPDYSQEDDDQKWAQTTLGSLGEQSQLTDGSLPGTLLLGSAPRMSADELRDLAKKPIQSRSGTSTLSLTQPAVLFELNQDTPEHNLNNPERNKAIVQITEVALNYIFGHSVWARARFKAEHLPPIGIPQGQHEFSQRSPLSILNRNSGQLPPEIREFFTADDGHGNMRLANYIDSDFIRDLVNFIGNKRGAQTECPKI